MNKKLIFFFRCFRDFFLTFFQSNKFFQYHQFNLTNTNPRKGIELAPKELAEKLITDDLIRKILIPQLNGEDDIRADGRNYQYTYYFAILYKGVKAYKLVWCVDDNEPHVLGIMDCFRIRKYDRK